MHIQAASDDHRLAGDHPLADPLACNRAAVTAVEKVQVTFEIADDDSGIEGRGRGWLAANQRSLPPDIRTISPLHGNQLSLVGQGVNAIPLGPNSRVTRQLARPENLAGFGGKRRNATLVAGRVNILTDNGQSTVDVSQTIEIGSTGWRRQHSLPFGGSIDQVRRQKATVVEARNYGCADHDRLCGTAQGQRRGGLFQRPDDRPVEQRQSAQQAVNRCNDHCPVANRRHRDRLPVEARSPDLLAIVGAEANGHAIARDDNDEVFAQARPRGQLSVDLGYPLPATGIRIQGDDVAVVACSVDAGTIAGRHQPEPEKFGAFSNSRRP